MKEKVQTSLLSNFMLQRLAFILCQTPTIINWSLTEDEGKIVLTLQWLHYSKGHLKIINLASHRHHATAAGPIMFQEINFLIVKFQCIHIFLGAKGDWDFQISDLVKLIFNLFSQIHSPHFHFRSPGFFSDLLRSVQMLKRKWGAESNEKLPHLFILSETATLVPEFAVVYRLHCSRFISYLPASYGTGVCIGDVTYHIYSGAGIL